MIDRGVRGGNDKFLTAPAGELIGQAQLLFDDLAEFPQYAVADRMAVVVVDLLEVCLLYTSRCV